MMAIPLAAWLLTTPHGASIQVIRLERITLGLPDDWAIAHEAGTRAYESARRSALEREGIFSVATGRVLFQAEKRVGRNRSSLMITQLPPEAAQSDVDSWSISEVAQLGRLLGEATRTGLLAVGARDIVVTGVEKMLAGQKTAVRLGLEFTGPGGVRYGAAKYFVYTTSRTVVLTFQWTRDPDASGRGECERVLSSLRVE